MRGRPVLRVVALVGLILVAALGAAAPSHADTLRVGAAHLRSCSQSQGYCGSLRRALDPELAGSPTIPIGYQWLPATGDSRPRGTIVAVEGGPGYPSTGSLQEYLGTFAAARRGYNLLLVDNRGTGRSAVIRCGELDRYPTLRRASGPAFARVVGRCGGALDHRYRDRTGRFIHAADLYSTAYAAADLRAVIGRLALGRVTLYGDSYGSWFAQAYAARFPSSLRAVILDSTYPVRTLDPYYASSGETGRAVMDRVCARDPGCAAAGRGSTPVDRLAALLARVRAHPITGRVDSIAMRITPRTLADLVQDGGSEPYVWRELDASVRAALRDDPVPLLRLALDFAGNGGDADPGDFSDGDFMSVACTDYRQLFSMADPPAQRAAEFAASLRAAPAGAFAPFTAAEWTSMTGYSQSYDTCLDWPAPVHRAPVLGADPRPLPASVPLLAIGGDLDDLTPLPDVEGFGPTLGARVRVVDLHNTTHVTSEGDNELQFGARCARAIIDAFVADPDRLAALPTRCASRIPHLHTPGAYPATLSGAAPATVVSGPGRSLVARREVTVAAGALADATVRHAALDLRSDLGLRGGSWTDDAGRFRLDGVRFVGDATVSGTGRYRASDGATSGRLTVIDGGGHLTTATLSWNQRARRARARVGATTLTLPAP